MSTKIYRIAELFFVWGVIGGAIFSLSGALAAVQGVSLSKNSVDFADMDSSLNLIQGNSVLPDSQHYLPERKFVENSESLKRIRVAVTAYSSSPEETDSDPFITASGDWVRDGIVAANFLPFGTKLKIPELYGDKIFVVQDRMHPRKKYQVDIWFPSRKEAIKFGAHYTYIELVKET